MESLAEKLKKEIDQCDWSMLGPLHEKELIFVVDESLKLEEVGAAVAEDDAEKVKSWQGQSLLRRPTADEVNSWSSDKYKKLADFIIIQPFVMIKLLGRDHE